MRATRDLPLAAALVLLGYALFFGGGVADGALPWLGGGALVAVVCSAAALGVPRGAARLAPLAALVAWLATTIAWSALPDRSWSYADRTLVYLLLALLGLWLAPRRQALALGLGALLGAVAVAALATKVVPTLHDYSLVARLSAPIGLWNQLALLAAFALPLALWRRGVAGALLAYAWLVALVLTYSRGGIVTALVVLALWFWLDEERLRSAATLAAAAVPAAVVVGVAFALPGVTRSGQSLHTRWVDGGVFAAVLGVGAAAAAAAALRLTALTRTHARIALGVGACAAAAVVAVAVVRGGGAGELSNGGQRFTSTSSNFRTVWWRQALDGWRHHVLGGTGGGSFRVTNLRYRHSSLDNTIEPHDLPLQFGTETGVVGLLLWLLATAALLRGTLRRRGHELALALLLPAFLVHSLVDIDWDFAAVAAPAFVAAGALAGEPRLRRVAPSGALVAAGAAVALFLALLMPWLGHRWEGQALSASLDARSAPRALSLANRALSVDPFIAAAYADKAFAAESLGESPRTVFAYYRAAVRREPANPFWWQLAGDYALSQRCYRTAYTYLLQYTEREAYGSATQTYNEARDQVNAGHNNC
ncbi:MAG TPA: O-antigen ligase family protein [Gaiellaceae bacterium]|nr:O-antigen ligase family protein [Gaiellaceae bacterium]